LLPLPPLNRMTPEKLFDYLEGKLPPAEKERLERALISDPKLQEELASARAVHRAMQSANSGKTAATIRAGNRGRQVAAAFIFLIAMNVALGLIYVFKTNKPNEQVLRAKNEALRHQLESSVERSAAATFTPPTIASAPINLTVPRDQQNTVAQKIIDAANRAGGSATRDLPNDNGFKVLVIVPASGEAAFRQMLAGLGGPASPPATAANPSAAPNEPVRLDVILAAPAQ
jgi:hypothetical protein